MPEVYQTYLQRQLSRSEYLLLTLLIQILQSIKQVKLEILATALPIPITFESRRKKLRRFLSLPHLTIERIWTPLLEYWIQSHLHRGDVAYLAIDRTNWGAINLLMVSWVWNNRAYPVYWSLLPKKGSTNATEQIQAISQVLELFRPYTIVVLGDREFCSVALGDWLKQQRVYFCLRLKRSESVELEADLWFHLCQLGLTPGVSLFFNDVKITKQKGFGTFNLAAKWKRNYPGWSAKEGWFILTNWSEVESAVIAYSKRFCIEEMFRDFKAGGYDLEGTAVTGKRFCVLVLLIAIAYTVATEQGATITRKGIQKYVGRVKEIGRTYKRHSNFYIGLYAQEWVYFVDKCSGLVEELLRLSPNKRKYYQKGMRAMELILATF